MTGPVAARVAGALPAVSEEERSALAALEPTRAAHEAAAASIPALSMVELVPPGRVPAERPLPVRVAAWNAERLKYHAASRALMTAVDADVWLLTEVDVGMARSGNVHTVRASAPAGSGWALATEFVELGLGDAREVRWHAGERNAAGLHGNAIVSRLAIEAPHRIALDDGAVWFTAARKGNQRRIGGRMAVAARVGGLWCVSVHLESESDTVLRETQTERLLAALDGLCGDAPAVIGGDLNTAALARGEPAPLEALASVEPLFAALQARGFDWRACNTADPTQRQRPDGTPLPPFGRLDWLACRGLDAGNARTVPATDGAGVALSDHDVVVADFAPAGRTGEA